MSPLALRLQVLLLLMVQLLLRTLLALSIWLHTAMFQPRVLSMLLAHVVVGLSLLLQIRKALLRAAGILLKQKLVVMYSKVLLVKRRFLQAI